MMREWSKHAQKVRHQFEDFKDLGWQRTTFRILWEARARSGYFKLKDRIAREAGPAPPLNLCFFYGAAAPERVLPWAGHDVDLLQRARNACQGKIRCFGRWTADFGPDPDWFLDPQTGHRFLRNVHWTAALRSTVGSDVKHSWELGRFPHAYDLARAAVVAKSEERVKFAAAFWAHVRSFVAHNPVGVGIHWHSGQEIVVRCVALVCAAETFASLGLTSAADLQMLGRLLYESARHVDAYIEFAQHAVYNNHLIAEAFGLLFFAHLFPEAEERRAWSHRGQALLHEATVAQFADDGGYIQNSHNYHRIALQYLVWTSVLCQRTSTALPSETRRAINRSIDFLLAHQNGEDGRLPNFGSNDGGLPSILSSCDYSDFRPTITAACEAVQRPSPYLEGPWFEESAWCFGTTPALGQRTTNSPGCASFPLSGYHVLRAAGDTFACLRCGPIRDRFHQLDMMHVDLFWGGENVLVDAGSYQYNGAPKWHQHFVGSESHNTVRIDDQEQMVLFRQFRMLYPPRAELLGIRDTPVAVMAHGRHFGYRRLPDGVTHHRSVALLKAPPAIMLVVDEFRAQLGHTARLHWLCGVPAELRGDGALLRAREPLQLLVGRPQHQQWVPIDLVTAQDEPPRGWVSRYYGEKSAAWSIRAEADFEGNARLLTILAPSTTRVSWGSNPEELLIESPQGSRKLSLRTDLVLTGDL